MPEALAGRLGRLVRHYVDAEEAPAREADAPAWTRERAQAEFARLRALVLEMGRLAGHLSDSLVVSCQRKDSAEARDARQALAAVIALCAVVRRAAGDVQDRLAAMDPDLPGLLATRQV